MVVYIPRQGDEKDDVGNENDRDNDDGNATSQPRGLNTWTVDLGKIPTLFEHTYHNKGRDETRREFATGDVLPKKIPNSFLEMIKITSSKIKYINKVIEDFLARVIDATGMECRMRIIVTRTDKKSRSTLLKIGGYFCVNLSSPYIFKFMPANMKKLTVFGNTHLNKVQWMNLLDRPTLKILRLARDWIGVKEASNLDRRNAFSYQFLMKLNPKEHLQALRILRIYMPLRLNITLFSKLFRLPKLKELVIEDMDFGMDEDEEQKMIEQVLRSLRELDETTQWTFEVKDNRIVGTKVSLEN